MIEPPGPEKASDNSKLAIDSFQLKKEVWRDATMNKIELQNRIDEISEITKAGGSQKVNMIGQQ